VNIVNYIGVETNRPDNKKILIYCECICLFMSGDNFGTKLAGEETDLAAQSCHGNIRLPTDSLYIFINIYTLTIGWLLAFFRPVVELLPATAARES